MFLARKRIRRRQTSQQRKRFQLHVEALEDRCLLAATLMDHIQLDLGVPQYWDGPYVEQARVAQPALCGTAAGPCWAYEIELTQTAERLRIALDHPDDIDHYHLQVTDPTGRIFQSDEGNYMYSLELSAFFPSAGTWTVEVLPQDVAQSPFRMRAELEAAPPSAPQLLKPNLQIMPPWEFTFIAPADPEPGSPTQLVTREAVPLDVAGQHPFSCTADEMNDGAQHCLRFSFGTGNANRDQTAAQGGPFEVYYDDASPLPTDPTEPTTLPIKQRVYWSDSTPENPHYEDYDAGTVYLHPTHKHFHVQNIVQFTLYQVLPNTAFDPCAGVPYQPDFVEAGDGAKLGITLENQKIVDWDRFNQHRWNSAQSEEPAGGLSFGWADIYRWQAPSNFVEFGDNADGFYLIRGVPDPNNRFVESVESEVSYSYIEGKDNASTVVLLERGYGSSPWDPNKRLPDDYYAPATPFTLPPTPECPPPPDDGKPGKGPPPGKGPGGDHGNPHLGGHGSKSSSSSSAAASGTGMAWSNSRLPTLESLINPLEKVRSNHIHAGNNEPSRLDPMWTAGSLDESDRPGLSPRSSNSACDCWGFEDSRLPAHRDSAWLDQALAHDSGVPVIHLGQSGDDPLDSAWLDHLLAV